MPKDPSDYIERGCRSEIHTPVPRWMMGLHRTECVLEEWSIQRNRVRFVKQKQESVIKTNGLRPLTEDQLNAVNGGLGPVDGFTWF